MGIHGIFWRWPTGNKLTMAATSPKSEEGGWLGFLRGVGRGFGGKLVDEEEGGSIDAKGWAPKNGSK